MGGQAASLPSVARSRTVLTARLARRRTLAQDLPNRFTPLPQPYLLGVGQFDQRPLTDS